MNSLAAETARRGGRDYLAEALRDARTRTLALLDAYAAVLGESLTVPYSVQLNPPRWEAGHVAWFQDYWIARNRQRDAGTGCDPEHERPVGRMAEADARYNSSKVAHTTRWQLDLPDLVATRDYLDAVLADTLALLAEAPETDAGLYFYRLVLFHEDMHGEAGIYMAQALDIPLPAQLLAPPQTFGSELPLDLEGGRWTLGWPGAGFAFDNELGPTEVVVRDYSIDRAPVTWRRYLPFLDQTGAAPPRYLRRTAAGDWERKSFGSWEPLPIDEPATHLTYGEAEAWCRWAGRRLPTEAEWEMAVAESRSFLWGQVWEWTASRFDPFPGFVAHPYRDYSAPWFGDRPVLKGASRATNPRMAHPRYRNYFTVERNDIPNGFRSCALY